MFCAARIVSGGSVNGLWTASSNWPSACLRLDQGVEPVLRAGGEFDFGVGHGQRIQLRPPVPGADGIQPLLQIVQQRLGVADCCNAAL